MAAIVASGAEVACHGYAHEDAAKLSPEQERDVIVRCVEVLQKAGAPRPSGWRAPLYSVREETLELLEELGFEYGGFVFLYASDFGLLFLPKKTFKRKNR